MHNKFINRESPQTRAEQIYPYPETDEKSEHEENLKITIVIENKAEYVAD